MGLIFHCLMSLQSKRWLLVFNFADSERHQFGSTCDGFWTEIVCIFHGDYFDYRDAFKISLFVTGSI